MSELVSTVRVRRWLEDESTPVTLETTDRRACGTASDHVRKGCIALAWNNGRGTSGLFHLTTADALRLSDLLRAMADANPDTEVS